MAQAIWDDLAKATPEATQSGDIVEFVDAKEIDPILFDKPYYLVPEKRGRARGPVRRARAALRARARVSLAQRARAPDRLAP